MYKIGSIGDGFLAIMARPSLEQGDAASMKNIARLGIKLVVSLLEVGEARQLELDGEREFVKAEAMDFLSYPIPDMGLPASVEDFARMSKLIFQQTYSGINTLVHCHAGIGRSGLLAAGILLHCQMDPGQAFAHVSKMRGIRVPETPEQTAWLISNYEAILSFSGSDQ